VSTSALEASQQPPQESPQQLNEEALEGCFELLRASDTQPRVCFEWKFPSRSELQDRKAEIRESLAP
jgi:hypothetical protein